MMTFVIDKALQEKGLNHKTMVQKLEEFGITPLHGFDGKHVRIVTHRDVDRADLQFTRDCISKIVEDFSVKKVAKTRKRSKSPTRTSSLGM